MYIDYSCMSMAPDTCSECIKMDVGCICMSSALLWPVDYVHQQHLLVSAELSTIQLQMLRLHAAASC